MSASLQGASLICIFNCLSCVEINKSNTSLQKKINLFLCSKINISKKIALIFKSMVLHLNIKIQTKISQTDCVSTVLFSSTSFSTPPKTQGFEYLVWFFFQKKKRKRIWRLKLEKATEMAISRLNGLANNVIYFSSGPIRPSFIPGVLSTLTCKTGKISSKTNVFFLIYSKNPPFFKTLLLFCFFNLFVFFFLFIPTWNLRDKSPIL